MNSSRPNRDAHRRMITEFNDWLGMARSRTAAAHRLLNTAGMPPGEAVYALRDGWQAVAAAMGLLAGRDEKPADDRSSVSESSPPLLVHSPPAALEALETAYRQYRTGGAVELDRRQARRLLKDLHAAVDSLEYWQHSHRLWGGHRHPRVQQRLTWFAFGALALIITVIAGVLLVDWLTEREGLRGTYFSNRDFTGKRLERIDPNIDFAWKAGAPLQHWPVNNFSIRWTGCLIVDKNRSMVLAAGADDGILVYVDDQLVVDNGGTHAFRIKKATEPLKRGLRRIRVEYTEHRLQARVLLGWSKKDAKPVPIPPDRFIPPGQERDGYTCP